jgi:hypothetical protein
MSRFYFHIRDGEGLVPDEEGMDLLDLEAAKNEAVISAREIMANNLRSGRPLNGQWFEIVNEAGDIVATVKFKDVIPQPATESARESSKRKPLSS